LSSYPAYLTNVNGTVFFNATDGVNGEELWKSDGTSAGTVLVRDIFPGSSNSSLASLTNVNGTLFFRANNGVNGYELWKSDGTSAGTVLVRDIVPGSAYSAPNYLTNVNGTLFFSANNGVNGAELWKSDGTSAGTVLVRDIFPGSYGSSPNSLTNVNGTLFFRANNGVNGVELWKSDGTSAGTVLVRDISPGSYGSYPQSLINVNGTLFFNANDGVNGRELWKATAGDVTPPMVTSSAFEFEESHVLAIGFSESVQLTLDTNDLTIVNSTLGFQILPSSLGLVYDAANDTATLTFSGFPAATLIDGNYRVNVVAAGVTDTAGNSLDGDGNGTPNDDFVFNFFVLSGDANRDRSVNLDDFTALAASFGQPNRVFSQGNFNYSAGGVVNLDDFTILAAQFGKTLAAPSDVPRAFARAPISAAKPQAEELRFSTTRIIDELLTTANDVIA